MGHMREAGVNGRAFNVFTQSEKQRILGFLKLLLLQKLPQPDHRPLPVRDFDANQRTAGYGRLYPDRMAGQSQSQIGVKRGNARQTDTIGRPHGELRDSRSDIDLAHIHLNAEIGQSFADNFLIGFDIAESRLARLGIQQADGNIDRSVFFAAFFLFGENFLILKAGLLS